MNQKHEEIRKKRQERVAGIFKYFSLIMGVFYFILGVVFYLYPVIGNLDEWARIAISTLLVVYGVFRLWRAIKS